jgi:hypothetical protein
MTSSLSLSVYLHFGSSAHAWVRPVFGSENVFVFVSGDRIFPRLKTVAGKPL